MRFGILGPLLVSDAGRDVPITAGRDRVVLAVLLAQVGQVISATELVDAVWAADPPATARGQVQTCVSRLRRVLPPGTVVTDPAGYGITLADDDLDAALFARLVERARVTAATAPEEAGTMFREALALWRGPAFAGVEAAPVRRRAAVLDEQRAAAIEDWFDLELAAGRERDIVAQLTGLVEEFPLRERLRAQLMLALSRIGRQSDALAEYRRVRDLLGDELGIEPGTALQELHRRILTGDLAPAAGARTAVVPVRSLPRTVGDFTGREEAVAALLRAAAERTVLTIDGMAGSGKTTLALRVAGLLGDACPDAQLFVDLRGHSEDEPLEPAAALLALLRQLGVDADRIPADLDARAGLWRSELAARRALVVFDNAASSAQVAPLLPGSPTVVSVVTSRRRLAGLDGVHPESLPVLDEAEGVALLTRIVGEPRVRAEPEAAVAVVRRCGHLPLAIRLAGSRLAHRPRWGLSDLVRRLGTSALPELAAEDRTVASAFALSYEQLPARAQRVFRLLGLHPGERFGALAVAALTGLTCDEAQDVLDDLVDVHLLEEPRPERYRMHDLVREYAAVLAGSLSRDDRHAALAGLVDLHLHVGTRVALARESDIAHQDFPKGPPSRPDLVALGAADPDWPEEHRAEVVPLIRMAVTIGQHGVAWRLARVTWRFLFQHGYFADLLAICEAGYAAADQAGDRHGTAVMNNYLASGYFRLGRPEDALSRVTAMLEHQIRAGNESGEGRARANLGGVLTHLGRLSEGLAEIHRGYRLLARRGHETGLVVLRVDMGWSALWTGRYADALRHARIALQRIAETGLDSFIAGPLIVMGQARQQLGDLGQAERLLKAALKAARRHGIRTDESQSMNALGALELARGRPAAAIERHLAALELGREHGRLPRLARYSNDLALAVRAVDDIPGAIELHRQALAAARRATYPLEEGRALSGLAACVAVDDPATARRYWTQALEIFTRMGVPERYAVRRRLAVWDERARTGPG